jgi:allantoin racemase
VRAAQLPVLSIHDEIDETAALLEAEARVLMAEGADVIVLGCAGMAGLDVSLERMLGVPVIDGVGAAVGLAEVLVRMGKRTSKAGPFSPPIAGKHRPGWPVSESLARPVGAV